MGIVKVSRYPLSPFELPRHKSRLCALSTMFQSGRAATLSYPDICAGISNDNRSKDSRYPTRCGLNGCSQDGERLGRFPSRYPGAYRSAHISSRRALYRLSRGSASPSDTCRSIFSLYYFKSKSRIQILKQLHLIARIRCKPKSCRMLRRGLAPHLNLIDYNPPHTESIMFI